MSTMHKCLGESPACKRCHACSSYTTACAYSQRNDQNALEVEIPDRKSVFKMWPGVTDMIIISVLVELITSYNGVSDLGHNSICFMVTV